MMRLAIFLVALLLQQAPRASIEGAVVYLSSGEPATGAEVELTGVEGGRVISRTVKVSASGTFSFQGLPPGNGYQIVARGPSFRPTAFGQRSTKDPWTSIDLSQGQRLTDVRITVQGITQIGGRVLERSGKIVAGASVLILKPVYIEDRRELQIAAATVTSIVGEYRFSGLPSGRYYIRVNPPNDSAVAPLFFDPGLFDRNSSSTRRNSVSNTPEGYPTTYYPGVNIESAKPIWIADGQVLSGLDTVVTTARTGRVRGNVIEGSPSRRILTSEMLLIPVDRSPDSSFTRSFSSIDGTFDIRAVQPGTYYLDAVATDQKLAGRMQVEIRGGQTSTLDVRVSPVKDILGKMIIEGLSSGLPNLSAFSVTLTPNVSGPIAREPNQRKIAFPSVTTAVMPDGTFTLPRVVPGDYRVRVSPASGGYIKSVRLGGSEVIESGLRIDERTERSLEIILATDTGSLDGRVLNEKGQDVQAARVVLVPEARQRRDLYLAVATSPTGRFQMSGIAPGRYSIFAWGSTPAGAWFDPDFLEHYKGVPAAVEISPQSAEYVEIKLIPN